MRLPSHVLADTNVPGVQVVGVLSVALLHVTARAPGIAPQATQVPFST
jgi:hypothetical protein